MIPASLTGHILELVRYVTQSSFPANRIVKEFFRSRKYLGSHDRRTISNAIFGLLRHRRYLETLLEQFAANNPGTEILNDPVLRELPLFAGYSELIDPEVKVPESFWKIHFPNIDFSQYLSWLRQNSPLDFLINDHLLRLGVKYSFADWMVRAWHERISDETEELLKALNNPAPTTLRVNTILTEREECRNRLLNEGIETEFTRLSPVGLITKKRFNSEASQTYKDGWFEIQDEGSQLISLLAQPKRGEFVIDACAGAGGKSLHMADLMENEGEIVAFDINTRRLQELKRRAERAHIDIIRAYSSEEIETSDFFRRADLILVDAPCSGSGTIRRNPGLKWSITPSLVDHYTKLQQEILTNNSNFLKPEGILVYATCSLFPAENESVINNFLDKNPDYNICPINDRLKNYNLSARAPYLTLFPHREQSDGYFIAILRHKN